MPTHTRTIRQNSNAETRSFFGKKRALSTSVVAVSFTCGDNACWRLRVSPPLRRCARQMPPNKRPDVQTVAGHGHEVVQSADVEFECGTRSSSAASHVNADEHERAAHMLTGHGADAGFACGVAALSCDVARRGMEGYVRPYARDCCAAVLAVCA